MTSRTLAAAQQQAIRGAHRLREDEALASKRERRRQRRKHNQELRERASVHAFGYGPVPERESKPFWNHASVEWGTASNVELRAFRALFGKARSSKEQQMFSRAWRQWRAQGSNCSKHDDIDHSSSSSSSRSGREGQQSSSRGGHWSGLAGSSAGPRWGRASWTWEDFRAPGTSSGAFQGFGLDHEAWYGCHGADSEQRRRGSSQQRGSSGHNGGTTCSAGSTAHSRHAADLAVLGLDASWLRTRCGTLLRRAYLTRAKQEHPDVHACAGAAAAAEHRFKQVQSAYQSLLPMTAR